MSGTGADLGDKQIRVRLSKLATSFVCVCVPVRGRRRCLWCCAQLINELARMLKCKCLAERRSQTPPGVRGQGAHLNGILTKTTLDSCAPLTLGHLLRHPSPKLDPIPVQGALGVAGS